MIRKFGEIEGDIVHLYEIENEQYAIGMLDSGATLVYWTSKQAKQIKAKNTYLVLRQEKQYCYKYFAHNRV